MYSKETKLPLWNTPSERSFILVQIATKLSADQNSFFCEKISISDTTTSFQSAFSTLWNSSDSMPLKQYLNWNENVLCSEPRSKTLQSPVPISV